MTKEEFLKEEPQPYQNDGLSEASVPLESVHYQSIHSTVKTTRKS